MKLIISAVPDIKISMNCYAVFLQRKNIWNVKNFLILKKIRLFIIIKLSIFKNYQTVFVV